MGKRERITIRGHSHYAERRKDGTFKKHTNIGRSIRADKRKKSFNRPRKPGYGHRGDYALF